MSINSNIQNANTTTNETSGSNTIKRTRDNLFTSDQQRKRVCSSENINNIHSDINSGGDCIEIALTTSVASQCVPKTLTSDDILQQVKRMYCRDDSDKNQLATVLDSVFRLLNVVKSDDKQRKRQLDVESGDDNSSLIVNATLDVQSQLAALANDYVKESTAKAAPKSATTSSSTSSSKQVVEALTPKEIALYSLPVKTTRSTASKQSQPVVAFSEMSFEEKLAHSRAIRLRREQKLGSKKRGNASSSKGLHNATTAMTDTSSVGTASSGIAVMFDDSREEPSVEGGDQDKQESVASLSIENYHSGHSVNSITNIDKPCFTSQSARVVGMAIPNPVVTSVTATSAPAQIIIDLSRTDETDVDKLIVVPSAPLPSQQTHTTNSNNNSDTAPKTTTTSRIDFNRIRPIGAIADKKSAEPVVSTASSITSKVDTQAVPVLQSTRNTDITALSPETTGSGRMNDYSTDIASSRSVVHVPPSMMSSTSEIHSTNSGVNASYRATAPPLVGSVPKNTGDVLMDMSATTCSAVPQKSRINLDRIRPQQQVTNASISNPNNNTTYTTSSYETFRNGIHNVSMSESNHK